MPLGLHAVAVDVAAGAAGVPVVAILAVAVGSGGNPRLTAEAWSPAIRADRTSLCLQARGPWVAPRTSDAAAGVADLLEGPDDRLGGVDLAHGGLVALAEVFLLSELETIIPYASLCQPESCAWNLTR